MEPEADADRRARFEALVQSTYVPLQRYLRRRTDAASADDVLGDVFLVLWRRVDEIPAASTLAWCFGVARGCLANADRSAERRRRLVRRLSAVAVPVTSTLPEEPDLHEALDALAPGDREVLRLWAWEQLQPGEIAVALGVTPNAASIRLHRARQRLRDQLTSGRHSRPGTHPGEHQEREAPR